MNTLPVNFHGNTLYIIDHNNEPYTPMKPIVEGMGLAWQVQLRKLSSNPKRWGITKMVTPSLDAHNEATCIPLRKLFGWLCTISPNKVKPELKETIIRYQNECDEVLYQHWTQRNQPQPIDQNLQLNEMTAADRDFVFRGSECTPAVSADGRHWLAHNQLNSLLGYRRRDVVKMLYGQHAEQFDPNEVTRIEFDDEHGHDCVLAFEASAWPKLATYSKCQDVSGFIRLAQEYATDHVSIPREEWEEIKHHAHKSEEQYREIAKASNQLSQKISESQMTFGINKILTQKH